LRNVDRRRSLGNTAAALPEMAVPSVTATPSTAGSRSGYVVISIVSRKASQLKVCSGAIWMRSAILARRL
jgi:hypothetical protein